MFSPLCTEEEEEDEEEEVVVGLLGVEGFEFGGRFLGILAGKGGKDETESLA